MAKKKHQKLTAEDRAHHERIMAMVRKRIAYHERKALEQRSTRLSDQQ